MIGIAPAAAEPRPMKAEAKLELDHGREKFSAHDYAGAITAFDAGYAIDPHPDFLYAKAQAQRLGGDCNSAIVTYQAFIATDPPQSEGELARSNIQKCEQVLAASKPTPPTDTPPTDTPPPHPTDHPVAPPHPQQVETPSGPASGEPAPWWRDTMGIALAGGGAVLLGVAAVYAARASSAADDTSTANTLDDWTTAHDAWQQDRIVAGVAAGIGAALVIGAGFRFWSLDNQRGSRLSATPTHGGATLAIEGTW